MSVLPDDQMNSVINYLTAKSTWDDLILYHEGPSNMKESRVMDLKLCYNTFKFKEGESLRQTFTRYKALMNELVNDGIKLSKLEINTGFINGLPKKWLSFCQSLRNTNHVKDFDLASLFGKLKYEENLIDSIYETEKSKSLVSATPLSTAFFSTSIVQDFQDSPDDEEDTRSSHEYLNNLEEKYKARAFLAKSKRRVILQETAGQRHQLPFQPKLLYSSDHKPEPRRTKDFEAKYNKVKAKLALLMSSDDNEVTKVKALMALTDEERVFVGKESANNGEWVKISIQKVHALLEMEDNDDRKSFLDYLCIDLNYVEEQRINLLSKHRNLVHKLNTCKEQLLVLKQAKLDRLTMQHVNTEILNENQNLRNELKELTSITKAWLNSSNKVNQCISEQIPTQKKKILGIYQLTKDTFSSGAKDPVFVKSLADNSEVSITVCNKHKLSGAEDFTLSNHDIGKVPSNESQRNTTDHSIFDSSVTDYDSVDESLVCSTVAPTSSTQEADCIILFKVNLSQDPDLQGLQYLFLPAYIVDIMIIIIMIVYTIPLVKICRSCDHDTHGHNKIISLRRGINPRNPQHVTKNYETCDSNVHTTSYHNDIKWLRKRETLQAKNAESFKVSKNESSSALKELTSITKAWLNNSNKVNQCISEQIPTQKKKILGIDQLTEDTFRSGAKDPVFVKSSTDNSEVSITGCNKHKLSEAEDFTLSNHDTGKHGSTPLPPLEKLTGAEPVSGPKTIKSILKSKSTFKAETLKGVTINEPSSTLARGKVLQLLRLIQLLLYLFLPAYIVDIMIIIIMIVYTIPLVKICGSCDHDTHGHNTIISLRRGINPRNPQHVTKNCETCDSNVYTTSYHNEIEWLRKRETLQSKNAESFKVSKNESSSALRSKTPAKSLGLQYLKHSGFDQKDTQTLTCRMQHKHEKYSQFVITNIIAILNNPIMYSNQASDNHLSKRLIDELGMLNIDSKPEASVLTEEN
ncbi:hypothetical protein Tco_0335942 [Tanacetum coccineum]